jgi:hypothetical protein
MSKIDGPQYYRLGVIVKELGKIAYTPTRHVHERRAVEIAVDRFNSTDEPWAVLLFDEDNNIIWSEFRHK